MASFNRELRIRRGRPKGQSNDKKSYGPLGDLIRSYRLKRQMGLAEVAKACKCSVQFISNIEHGRAPLPWDKAERLAKALELPLDELQAANLAMRSDFQTFLNSSKSTKSKKSKPATISAGAKSAATWLTLASQDSQLREIIERYQSATTKGRKALYQSAKTIKE